MASEDSLTSKRFRSEDSSIDPSLPSSSSEIFSCSFCIFNTNSSTDFDFHNHIHHQHLCSQCLHVFPSYFLLDLHMDEVHNHYSTIRSYRCLIESCSKTFTTLDQRFQHINDEHYTKNRDLNEIYSFFSNKPNHPMKINENEKKFGCDSQKTFIRNSRLKPRTLLDTHWDGDDE